MDPIIRHAKTHDAAAVAVKHAAPAEELAEANPPTSQQVELRQAPTPPSEYGGDAGLGMEGMGADELLIPFFRILQSNSPQVEDGNGKYIDGARAGMILNTATQELIDGMRGGFQFIPVFRDHNFIEYVPRDAGGGFVSIWGANDERLPALRQAQGQFGKMTLGATELVETFYLFGIAITQDGYAQKAVLGFSSTQIKKYKQVTTRISNLVGQPPRYPIFAFKWRFGTIGEKNKKGSFFGWRPVLDGETAKDALMSPGDPLYLQAREFYKQLKDGRVKADFSVIDGDDDAQARNIDTDDDIPM